MIDTINQFCAWSLSGAFDNLSNNAILIESRLKPLNERFFMPHVFKKVSLVLAALVGIQAFGSETSEETQIPGAKYYLTRLGASAGLIGLGYGTAWFGTRGIEAFLFDYRTARKFGAIRNAGLGMMAAGALVPPVLVGLKFYNSKIVPQKEFRAFKERTPVYDYWTLGDSY
jgi:hypothetical protein